MVAKKVKKPVKQDAPAHFWPLFTIASFVVALIIGFLLYWYLPFSTPRLPNPPLKDLAAQHQVGLGVHVVLNRLHEKPYANVVTSQYAFATIDGEANWIITRPSPTSYNYSKVDQLVNFAKNHSMGIQLHHLLWGEAKFLPNWLLNGNYSQAQLLSLIHEDVSSTVGRYKGQIGVWSVVNEAFSRAQHLYGLHDWWADHAGQSYIDNSFIWAHQADPKATLLLNDTNNETENSISNAEYSYLSDALKRGIPIEGIGMQMHINAAQPPSKQEVIKNMQRFAALGLPIYVTEFDVNVNSLNGSESYKNSVEAAVTSSMVRACIESKVCVSFDEFGVTEKNNLLKSLFKTDSHSYLLNSKYDPKPSFYAFRSAWQQP